MSFTVTIRLAECHDICTDVVSSNGHHTNVNPVGFIGEERWRVDCDSCMTCYGSDYKSKKAAVDAAYAHVRSFELLEMAGGLS